MNHALRIVLIAQLVLHCAACALGSEPQSTSAAARDLLASDAGSDAGFRDMEPSLADQRPAGDAAASGNNAPPQEGTCGDGVCNGNESCNGCSPDCGLCPTCELAPSCTGAVALPSASLRLESFDNGDRVLYSSGIDEATGERMGVPYGETDCVAPELRLRVRQIKVVLDGVYLGAADLYCIVNASDGAHSEVMITPLQQDVSDGAPPLIFSPDSSTFWGQGMPWQTLNNLTITYQCFHSVDNQSYKDVFAAIESGATSAGGIAGPWGWAFGVGSLAAGLIKAAIPKGHDETRIEVQQTIDSSMLLELTNGRRWQIRGRGNAPGIDGDWDWILEVESWGCSRTREPPN